MRNKKLTEILHRINSETGGLEHFTFAGFIERKRDGFSQVYYLGDNADYGTAYQALQAYLVNLSMHIWRGKSLKMRELNDTYLHEILHLVDRDLDESEIKHICKKMRLEGYL